MKKTNYNSAKKHLIIKALNLDFNKEELNDAVYKTIGDIALVLYAKISEEDDMHIFKITKDVFAEWNKDIENVFKDAMQNTCKSDVPRMFISISDAYLKHGSGINFMDKNCDAKLTIVDNPMITTENFKNGATALFYDGIKEKIAEMFGESFYVAFTSIHEAVVHRKDAIEPLMIKKTLRDINEHFGSEETLTTQVFVYDMETGGFDVVA